MTTISQEEYNKLLQDAHNYKIMRENQKAIQRRYVAKRYKEDPEFAERKREIMRKYRKRKKEQKQQAQQQAQQKQNEISSQKN